MTSNPEPEPPFREAIELGCAAAAGFRLAGPTVAPAGRSGGHRGALAGSSLDYKDFREYQPGDDLRHLDWNAYARTDKLTLKLYHEEVAPHLDILVDVSRSMDLPKSGKRRVTVALAAFFATAAGNGGFSHRLWLLGEKGIQPPLGQLHPLQWSPFPFEHRQSPVLALSAVQGSLKPRGLRVFLSDLLWEGDPNAVIAGLSGRAAGLMLVQVLAERDLRIEEGGKLRLRDSETGQTHELLLDAANREAYARRLERHCLQWRQSGRKAGALVTRIEAEKLLSDWRFEPEVYRRFLAM